eukprot:4646761-Amphidinium_carterae.1
MCTCLSEELPVTIAMGSSTYCCHFAFQKQSGASAEKKRDWVMRSTSAPVAAQDKGPQRDP